MYQNKETGVLNILEIHLRIFYIEFFLIQHIKNLFFYQGQHHLFPYPHKNFGVILILKYFILSNKRTIPASNCLDLTMQNSHT